MALNILLVRWFSLNAFTAKALSLSGICQLFLITSSLDLMGGWGSVWPDWTFFKVLGNTFSNERSVNILWLLEFLLENITFNYKLLWLQLFGQCLEKFAPLLISTSGHTDGDWKAFKWCERKEGNKNSPESQVEI